MVGGFERRVERGDLVKKTTYKVRGYKKIIKLFFNLNF